MNNYSQGDLYAALDDVRFPKMESQRSEIYDLGERMLWKKRVKSFLTYTVLWALPELINEFLYPFCNFSFVDGLCAVQCRGLLCIKS